MYFKEKKVKHLLLCFLLVMIQLIICLNSLNQQIINNDLVANVRKECENPDRFNWNFFKDENMHFIFSFNNLNSKSK